MSGRFALDSGGQLALMDAIVFFIAAMVISGMLLSSAKERADDAFAPQGDTSASEILCVFLRASVGERVLVDLEGGVYVDERADVAGCLAVEIASLEEGAEPSAFARLNEVIYSILKSVCNPLFDPHLVVVDVGSECERPILALPDAAARGENTYASSIELQVSGDIACMLQLTLCPAASPELVQV